MKLEKDERMTEIIKKYYDLLLYAITKDVNCYEDALDICQDVCAAFYCQYGAEEVEDMSDARAKALLIKMMKNKIVDYIRMRTRNVTVYMADCEEELYFLNEKRSCSIEDLVINREILREISRELQETGELWKSPIVLHAVAGLSYEQVSEILGVPPAVLRTRICRYRKQLHKKYREDDLVTDKD